MRLRRFIRGIMSGDSVVIEREFPAGTYRIVYDAACNRSFLFELIDSGFGFSHYRNLGGIDVCAS